MVSFVVSNPPPSPEADPAADQGDPIVPPAGVDDLNNNESNNNDHMDFN